ncbi:MAG: Hsp20/alpha crystallin family protein [Deltaproteobacteria bacterium]|nr:Hsp20/alpha crystallin family protein [Deltaproteobacteria bacterium]
MAEIKELQAKGKMEVPASAEQIKPGPVFTPNVDIFETDKEIIMLADIPGVKAQDLTIDLRDDTLTFNGEVKPIDRAEEDILIEYQVGSYYRQFTLAEVIDQSKIDAALNNGVLRLTLPKLEKAMPRQITIKVR